MKDHQETSLRKLLALLVESNDFYRAKIIASGLDPASVTLESFVEHMPFTTRDEWVENQLAHPPYGQNLTFPIDRYVHFSRTSGSTGKPMNWLDTAESWSSMLDSWEHVYRAADLASPQQIFFAFSFGPFLGFWTAYHAAIRSGHLAITGGGLSTLARLQLLQESQATVLCCTPTYAIRMAQVAEAEGIDLRNTAITKIVVAGEPGGSVPAIREKIKSLWNGAAVYDHHGMTEVGPVTIPAGEDSTSLVVLEDAYFAEVIDEELVLTTLKRDGSPLLRYRTGDRVDAVRDDAGRLVLRGGILGRTDDMVVIRGVNIFPAAVDQVVRSIPEVAEYQVDVSTIDAMQELAIRVEFIPELQDRAAAERNLGRALQQAFSLRIPTTTVESNTLPRFEFKAQRWNRHA